MDKSEFQQKYPQTFECLKELRSDNDMHFLDEFQLSDDIMLIMVEAEAQELEGEEFTTMAAGELEERKELVERKHLHKLDAFLEEAFDGALHNLIFK